MASTSWFAIMISQDLATQRKYFPNVL
jgi:hypothetical protein